MEEHLIRMAQEGLYLALLIAAPAVLASAVAGLLSGVLQATTQLQDPTLTLVPKILAVAVSLAIFAPWISGQLVRFGTVLWEGLPALAR